MYVCVYTYLNTYYTYTYIHTYICIDTYSDRLGLIIFVLLSRVFPSCLLACQIALQLIRSTKCRAVERRAQYSRKCVQLGKDTFFLSPFFFVFFLIVHIKIHFAVASIRLVQGYNARVRGTCCERNAPSDNETSQRCSYL